jgi:hypothetical protein
MFSSLLLSLYWGVTLDGVWIGNWIYLPLGTASNYRAIADLQHYTTNSEHTQSRSVGIVRLRTKDHGVTT